VFASNTLFKQIHVIVVARIAGICIDGRTAIASWLTNKLDFVVKPVVAIATQAKLEVFAFFGALFFRKVHEGNSSYSGYSGSNMGSSPEAIESGVVQKSDEMRGGGAAEEGATGETSSCSLCKSHSSSSSRP